MHESLRTFFNNQKLPGADPCAKLLGNTAKVESFTQFYKKHAEDIAVLSAGALISYMNGQESVSSEQSKAFKEGLAQLPLFLEQCFAETNNKKEKESPQASSAV